MFLKVDKEKAAKRGSVYIARVGKKVIAGRSKEVKLVDITLDIARDYAKGRTLPAITVLYDKKVRDTVKSESMLHALLHEYEDKGSYYLPEDALAMIWKDVK